MAVLQPRPTHIPYQCAKFGDDRALFNVILTCVTFKHVKGLYPFFDISVFYFSAVSRDIDLKFIQDIHRVVINSPKNWTSWVALSIKNIKTWASREMTSRKNITIFDFNGVNGAKHWHVAARGICHLWLPCFHLISLIDYKDWGLMVNWSRGHFVFHIHTVIFMFLHNTDLFNQ